MKRRSFEGIRLGSREEIVSAFVHLFATPSAPWETTDKVLVIFLVFILLIIAYSIFTIFFYKAIQPNSAIKWKKPLHWSLLLHFRGTLYHHQRATYDEGSRLFSIHKHAVSSELLVETAAVSAFSTVVEAAEQRMPPIPQVDIKHILYWRSRPGPVVSHRIPLFLGLLSLNPINRARMKLEPYLKTFVADTRSAAPRKRFHAALALAVLSKDAGSRMILLSLQVLETLTSIATSSDSEVRFAAVMAICNLSESEESRHVIVKPNTLRTLIALCQSRDPRVLACVVYTLGNIATFEDHRVQLLDAGAAIAIFPLILSDHVVVQAQAARALRYLTMGRRFVLRQLRQGASMVALRNPAALNRAKYWDMYSASMRFSTYVQESARAGILTESQKLSVADSLEKMLAMLQGGHSNSNEGYVSMPDDVDGTVEEEEEEEAEKKKRAKDNGNDDDDDDEKKQNEKYEEVESENEQQQQEKEQQEQQQQQEESESTESTTVAATVGTSAESESAGGDDDAKGKIGKIEKKPDNSKKTSSKQQRQRSLVKFMESDDDQKATKRTEEIEAQAAILRRRKHKERPAVEEDEKVDKTSTAAAVVAANSSKKADENGGDDDVDDAEGEEEESLKMQYSSDAQFIIDLTMKYMDVFKTPELDAAVNSECRNLCYVDLICLLLETCSTELPLLLRALRADYSAMERTNDNTDGTLVCRPLEASISILLQLRRMASTMAKEIERERRERKENGHGTCYCIEEVMKEERRQEMLQMSSGNSNVDGSHVLGSVALSNEDDAERLRLLKEKDSLSDGNYAVDAELQWTKPLATFLEEFFEHYPPQILTRQIPAVSGKPALSVNKQFARDVPSMIRVNGEPPKGSNDDEMIRFAYEKIMEGVNHKVVKANKIMSLATQNLGIWCYEQLCSRYGSDNNLLVMQGGQHHADVRTTVDRKRRTKRIVIQFSGLFRLQHIATTLGAPLKEDDVKMVRASLRLDFASKLASCSFSLPYTLSK